MPVHKDEERMDPFTDEEILKLRDYFQHGVPVEPEEGMALCDQLLAERAWAAAAMLNAPL